MAIKSINYRLYRAFRNQRALQALVDKDYVEQIDIFLDHLVEEDFRLAYENIEPDFIQVDFDLDKLCAKFVQGYYWPYASGDIVEIDGAKLRYLDSLPLSEEIELQANDGGLVYLYTGPRFIAYFELLEGELPEGFIQ